MRRHIICCLLATWCSNASAFDPLQDARLAYDTDQVYRMPEVWSSVIQGGCGRFLIVHSKTSEKLYVFDVLRAQIVHEMEGITEGTHITASREDLVLVMPGRQLVQRWSLADFKRKKVAVLPQEADRFALVGFNSDGPLLLGGKQPVLVDLQTLKPIDVQGKVI